ncbi:hypothetical protein B4135_4049 [Caldibacillus debilis]|uniref:Uncharacterized protein n=1 Tax=Caldibacillus debilis TaxID=301148 RepID=A0A150L7P6_9BACI|nr:hypothetical protein B4135_4049 [Caldibacillus debilis]
MQCFRNHRVPSKNKDRNVFIRQSTKGFLSLKIIKIME